MYISCVSYSLLTSYNPISLTNLLCTFIQRELLSENQHILKDRRRLMGGGGCNEVKNNFSLNLFFFKKNSWLSKTQRKHKMGGGGGVIQLIYSPPEDFSPRYYAARVRKLIRRKHGYFFWQTHKGIFAKCLNNVNV